MNDDETKTEITAADVVAFLQEQAAKLAAQTGVEYATIKCEVNAKYPDIEWAAYVDGGDHQRAETVEEVIAKQVAAMKPGALAERKRKEAAKLLAEAEALAPGSVDEPRHAEAR